MMLLSEGEEFEGVIERLIARHCSFGSCTLELHLPDHPVEDFGNFRSFSFTDARPFARLNLLIKQLKRARFRRLSRSLQEIVQQTSSSVQNLRGKEDGT